MLHTVGAVFLDSVIPADAVDIHDFAEPVVPDLTSPRAEAVVVWRLVVADTRPEVLI